MKAILKTVVPVILSVALFVTGCGTQSATNSSSGEKAGQATQTSKLPTPATLNIATAGDTNMADLQEKLVGKDFSEKNPGVSINVIGTGPGDAGSQTLYAKLKAQKDAGKTEWDIDVAVVHQSIMEAMINDGLLEKYVPLSANKSYVTSADSKNSLGTNVDGYVIPLFHSQVAIAYNPDKVKSVPTDFSSLTDWIKANPQRFGYNGVKNGMSGVAFVDAFTSWKIGDYKQFAEGPYDTKIEDKWPTVLKELKSLPTTITNGNNGTLDMLNRGEIDMGAVWVDMFTLWQIDGRMNPNYKEKLIAPGLPGQPMYVVIPKNAKNKDWAIKYADYLTSPDVQAKVIVEHNGWYPGIDANVVLDKVSAEGKKKLFTDITASDLSSKQQSFPLAKYMTDLNSAYEKN
ncbi:MAG: extracellular solute-binding protein [Desulfosporosinus sp.]|nr:extracellular solute-binding protein [Desulfosporosinus sp.]